MHLKVVMLLRLKKIGVIQVKTILGILMMVGTMIIMGTLNNINNHGNNRNALRDVNTKLI